MNKTETVAIMAVLKEAYPFYYRDKSKEELNNAINLWHEMFLDDDINIVKASVKAFIIGDTKGFPPSIGQIKEYIYNITKKEELTEIEAWGLVSKALKNGFYGADEEFNKLPSIIQKAIGSSDRLKEWSQVDEKTVQSVISSNFMRSYTAKSKTEKQYSKLTSDIKALIDKNILSISERGTGHD